ncbi:MAG: pyruvate kinase, partial [Rhodobacteraceae bacterium]|nr:pyruvate kinase [Paracoccaceae bacterium]
MNAEHDEPGARQAAALLRVMDALHTEIAQHADAVLARWTENAPCDPETMADLHNLAAWIALRRTDLRQVQRDLAALGLSSLGRCEGHVLAAIEAVMAALSRVAGVAPLPFPPADALGRGAARVSARRTALFCGARPGPITRIMATLPPEAADDPGLCTRLVAAGADCVRLNTAHDSPEAWARMAGHARAAAAAAGRPMCVLVDLAGPKLRVAAIAHDPRLRLRTGETFALVPGAAEPAPGLPAAVATLSHPEVLALLRPGHEVSVNDGKLRARVVASDASGSGAVLCEVTGARAKGERLRPEKGVNLPGLALPIPALTEADRGHLPAVLAIADLVGLSF